MTTYQITITAAHNGNTCERVYSFEIFEDFVESHFTRDDGEFDQVDHVAEEIADAINKGMTPEQAQEVVVETLTHWDTELPMQIECRARAI